MQFSNLASSTSDTINPEKKSNGRPQGGDRREERRDRGDRGDRGDRDRHERDRDRGDRGERGPGLISVVVLLEFYQYEDV